MAKTAKQIQGDILFLLKHSNLYENINGEVYRNGYRPRDSRLEDAVIIHTAGFPDEIQTGVVTINIYVPDIDPFNNGVFVENGKRTAEIERLADDWVQSLTCDKSNYRFRLQSTITTDELTDIRQHFVVISLAYSYYGEDDAPLNTNRIINNITHN